MPTDYLLNAVDCPSLVVPTALHDPESLTPGVFFSQQPAVPATLTTGLRSNAVRSENLGRYGGGAYAVAQGLDLEAGTGLLVNVLAGAAILDGPVLLTADYDGVVLVDGARNWIWLLQSGVPTAVAGSLSPPTGACCLLGSVLTAAGAISGNPDGSGRYELRGPLLTRRTGDAAAPTDTPSSRVAFLTRTAGGTYLWTGLGYLLVNARQVIDGWYEDNVPASQAPLAIPRYAAGPAFANSWIAFRAGYVSGVLVKSNAARVAGSLSVEVYKNGSPTGLIATLDATNTTFKGTAQAPGLDPFVPGDQLGIHVSTDGAWSPTSAGIGAALEVEY